VPVRPLGSVALACALSLTACSSDDDVGGAGTSAPTSPAPTTKASPTTRGATTSTTARVATDLAAARINLQPVVDGLDSPVAIAFRRDDETMYVAEQSGRVRAVDDGQLRAEPVLTVDVSGGNEQGLLGLAFSNDGTKLYVNYTDPSGDTHVVEYPMNGDTADASRARELLFVDQPFRNHNGGQVLVGPDQMLYVPLGDGGSAGDPQGNGQNLGTLLGKVLRIDPRPSVGQQYSVPDDNPFVGRSGARPEIWMYGLRNPWRMSFDRETGDTWIGDVGQGAYEEIDFARAGDDGINWGWSAREGAHSFRGGAVEGARDPIIENDRSNGECAIVGGYVYRGSAIPQLYGVYLWGDNCASPILGAQLDNGAVRDQRQLAEVNALTSFGEDLDGELYAVARGGTIFKIVKG
jgi:glucose/arabinose dehydrogenase